MHLHKEILIKGILIPLIFLYACNEQKKPDSYIARVNDSYLTEEKLSELIDSQFVSGSYRTAIIRSWIKQEVLFSEALKQGILEEKNFKSTIEKSRRQLASVIILENFAKTLVPEITDENLKYYFEENKSSFKLAFDSYLLNRISFSVNETAVQFRTELISAGWDSAFSKFSKDTSLIDVSSSIFLAEQDIYPVKVLRVLEGLYPLEISIVIPDDKGYYSVVQLIEKYSAHSVPPFEAIKKEVERRYILASNESAIENYIDELYNKNEIEINN